eukprot:CAMPEP_0197827032 /NCGR_PEP_ID=MMETSP1437-20131217/3909_1 /TAXON_ID=49252 ORGANISM="Eucampia antarctica, Strain CCMP1452" /NCGR_SAMPLE_ID=MMETSP1437 /ASSEMBLY_ACC=CAM_ASM_001096 /LENGTH=230 /DNA_ID=CAMNT_0043427735 /DNA_START=70 /DNA_END=762 /DNA_ORIENTATION=+
MTKEDNSTNKNKSKEEDMLPCVELVKTVGSTKWIALQTLTYRDPTGMERKWDMATRTTKQKKDAADAVIIIPLLYHGSSSNKKMETLWVHQFRPPVETHTVEFPAGLIDEGESSMEAALRELKEETGYVGNCQASTVLSPLCCMSPGMIDESVVCVLVHVDLDDPQNQNPKANCDEGEFITIQRVPMDQAMQSLLDSSHNMPIMGLYLFSLGFHLGLQHQHTSSNQTTTA